MPIDEIDIDFNPSMTHKTNRTVQDLQVGEIGKLVEEDDGEDIYFMRVSIVALVCLTRLSPPTSSELRSPCKLLEPGRLTIRINYEG
jgi:hypothetical protein